MNLAEHLTADQQADLRSVESVLVTGSSGVIGSSFITLLKELRSAGLFSGRIIAASKSQATLNTKLGQGDLAIDVDLTKPESLAKLPSADFVLHAAAPSAPKEFMARPLETIILNVEATRLLKGLASRKFMYVSSSEIYSGLDFPATEQHVGTTNTLHPRAAYINAKRVGEVITLNDSGPSPQPSGYAFRVALAFGHEGVKFEDSRLLYDLVRRSLIDGKLELESGGSMVRSYCYSPDLAKLMLIVALKGEGGLYNMGHDDPRQIREIAKIVAMKSGASFHEKPNLREPASGAPMFVRMDLTKLHSLVPDFVYTPFERGLDELISRFRYLLEFGPRAMT